MGFTEAKEDNIRYVKERHMTIYFPLCHICSSEVKSINYRRDIKYTCYKCKLEQRLSDKEKRAEESTAAKEAKLDKAIKRIAKVADIRKYDRAIKVINGKLHTAGWFQSTEEIMVALELVKSGIKARHQVKLGNRYIADFVIPDEKIVLEIDGRIFHSGDRMKKDKLRDDLIILALGADWEVIRITDDLINQNITKLVPAINIVKTKRKNLKNQNGGILPEWYSDD